MAGQHHRYLWQPPAWGGLCSRRGYDGRPEQLQVLRRRYRANISSFKQWAALGQTAELPPAPAAWLWDRAQLGMLGGSSPWDLGQVAHWAPSTLPSSTGREKQPETPCCFTRSPASEPAHRNRDSTREARSAWLTRSATSRWGYSRTEPQNCCGGGKWGSKSSGSLGMKVSWLWGKADKCLPDPQSPFPPVEAKRKLKARRVVGGEQVRGSSPQLLPELGTTSHRDISFPHQGGQAVLRGLSSQHQYQLVKPQRKA